MIVNKFNKIVEWVLMIIKYVSLYTLYKLKINLLLISRPVQNYNRLKLNIANSLNFSIFNLP